MAIPNHMCLGMDYLHSEESIDIWMLHWTFGCHLDATLDLPPFDADHRLVPSFVVVELEESIELTIR